MLLQEKEGYFEKGHGAINSLRPTNVHGNVWPDYEENGCL